MKIECYRFIVLIIFIFTFGCANKDESFYNAVTRGDYAEAERLLDEGANINYTNKNGKSALMEAVYFANNPSHFKIVTMLINKGIDVNIATHEYAMTALFMAVERNSAQIVKMLLENGADVNAELDSCYEGKTPLMAAADSKSPNPRVSIDIVKMLLDHGADINAVDEKGETAASYAKKNGRNDIVQLFAQYNMNSL